MKRHITTIILLLFALLSPRFCAAQAIPLRAKIDSMLCDKRLKAGIAMYDFSTGDTLSVRGADRFPMQSVFKFPIALAILRQVEAGHMSLGDSIRLTPRDLLPDTWSPIRERWPGGVTLTLADVIRYTVSQSDNNGCDVQLRMLGGPGRVEKYIHSLGIEDISIRRTEEQMHRAWNVQYKNQSTPAAMLALLRLFAEEKLLQPATQAFLWETMAATSTGSVRTKLPEGTVVAHKTGSSGRNAEGLSAATNDAGILCLPDGRKIAYVVFITDSTESDAVNSNLIADLARLLYTEHTKPPIHE